jgi:sterol desaturase/sphingolipid hydroxylase (fatty acid hydroxylase superfamily)
MYNLSFIPFLAYWSTCLFCAWLGKHKPSEKSFHDSKNTISAEKVFKNVLSLTASTIPGNCLLLSFNIISKNDFRWYYLLIGIWWIDTIEYATHYIMHKIPFLYKNFHKEHHRLHNPYSFGALYNSSFEATLTSSMMLYGFYLLGISFPEFITVTTLANIATVLDHSNELTFFNYKRM